MTFTAPRPAPPLPARICDVIAVHGPNAAALISVAATAGVITGIGPTADYTEGPLLMLVLALYGAGFIVSSCAASLADWLVRDETTAADDAAEALTQLTTDLAGDADPEQIHEALQRTHIPGQLADIVTAVRDLRHDQDDVALTLAADHLRQAQHHLAGTQQL